MDKEIAKRWVSALRSGEYNQGRGQLRALDGSMCCLGVLSTLAVKDGVAGKSLDQEAIDGEHYFPSARITEWAGFDIDPDTYGPHNVGGEEPLEVWCVTIPEKLRDNALLRERIEKGENTVALSELNDDFYYTFDDIADVVEKEWINDAA